MSNLLDLSSSHVYTTLYSTQLIRKKEKTTLKKLSWSIEEIEELRDNLNLTQEEFAQAIQVCLNTYRRWKQKKFSPNRKAVGALNKLAAGK